MADTSSTAATATGAANPQADMITAISKAADTLFKEVGDTVRQLGGKRQKEADIAAQMQNRRMDRLEQQTAPQPQSNTLIWVFAAIALIVIIAVIKKK